MQRDPRFDTLFQRLHQKPSQPAGLLQKIGAIIATVVIFGLALTFSVMFFAVVLAAGVVIWGYVWWRTRELRKVMREAQAQAARGGARSDTGRDTASGLIIEGEVIREVREDDRDGTAGPR